MGLSSAARLSAGRRLRRCASIQLKRAEVVVRPMLDAMRVRFQMHRPDRYGVARKIREGES